MAGTAVAHCARTDKLDRCYGGHWNFVLDGCLYQGEELFYGTLMRMQPWPRVATLCSVLAIVAATIGKKGAKVLVISAVFLTELQMFAIVLGD